MSFWHGFVPQNVSKVDILGFKHLNLDLSISRVEVIRDAILELMGNELGANLTHEMTIGILRVLNYIGGALIYIRSNFADRVKILSESWEEANQERDQTKQKQREAREKARSEAQELKEKDRLRENVEKDQERFYSRSQLLGFLGPFIYIYI